MITLLMLALYATCLIPCLVGLCWAMRSTPKPPVWRGR
jgi:hypothetical protein